ncbi:BAAT / Acyl-CoA thioester hydrolase C terminal [Catalinimonas alkaloidigena]|uniref:BAAT / Acyl-CoA thioester hydrolase C terminal n=1 Tax=Catalinimonas alkaloidigena TaxID=1075417 RepID=A0A1G9R1T1_9BACT|nr:acyl-CoA thioester hydrolase/BAAT C-terminal domain-containing protein [Catalinimonas alkaloidigena]SDM17198.1 BAAT / Acyl-CoA thioester hydrolase C terminal [Catalinimonas alkaloidigena]
MTFLKRIALITISVVAVLVAGLYLFLYVYQPPLSEKYGQVDAQLFMGEADHQPLIVAFGGSQGGNTWAEVYWAGMRNRLLQQGYAVLAIGYFNTTNTPETLDRISLDAIYDMIMSISHRPGINQDKIALLGSSKGGELVLNLASRYEEFDAVVALVPSHVTFPALTASGSTSSWMVHNQEIPTFKRPFPAIWRLLKGDPQGGLRVILENETYSKQAEIDVEKIRGPLLLLSARYDELWPSAYMSDRVVARLKAHQFPYYYQHISFEGKHHDTKEHFEVVFQFLDEHFK